MSVFDINENKRLHSIEGHAMAVRCLAFSPDSTLLLTGSDDMHARIYDVYFKLFTIEISRASNNLVGSYSGHGSWVLSAAFNPDGKSFASR